MLEASDRALVLVKQGSKQSKQEQLQQVAADRRETIKRLNMNPYMLAEAAKEETKAT